VWHLYVDTTIVRVCEALRWSEAGRALVSGAGAQAVLDHADPERGVALQAATAGRGPEVILEMRADRNLAWDLGAAAVGGRIVVIGSRGPVEINPRDAMRRDLVVRGMLLFNASAGELRDLYERIDTMLDAGSIRPVIRERVPLAEAARAHGAVLEPGAGGKLVLVAGDEP